MKPNMHPEYLPVTVTCACGNKFATRSGRTENFTVDICGACHPFFTGKVKLMDTEGRVERFRNKYKATAEKAAADKVVADKAAEKASVEKVEKKAKKEPEAKA